MATVPGDPNESGPDPYGGIPQGLRPGYPELLMAAAIHKQQQAMQFDALDPKDEGVVEGKVPLPKPRPKTSEVDGEMQVAGDFDVGKRPVMQIDPLAQPMTHGGVGMAAVPHTPEAINPNQKIELGTVFRGTEAGGSPVRSSLGDLGTGAYVTPHEWLAKSYGGGPTASVRAGTREVHQLEAKSLYPDDVAYVFGGSRHNEPVSIYSGNGIKLWEGEWSAKNMEDALADHEGIKAVIGTPGSIGINQISIRDPSILKRKP